MRRIAVIGCGGSGKTTLAIRIGDILGLPVLHVDDAYWQPDGAGRVVEPTAEQWRRRHEEMIARPSWGICWMKLSVLSERLAVADLVVFLGLGQLRLRRLHAAAGRRDRRRRRRLPVECRGLELPLRGEAGRKPGALRVAHDRTAPRRASSEASRRSSTSTAASPARRETRARVIARSAAAVTAHNVDANSDRTRPALADSVDQVVRQPCAVRLPSHRCDAPVAGCHGTARCFGKKRVIPGAYGTGVMGGFPAVARSTGLAAAHGTTQKLCAVGPPSSQFAARTHSCPDGQSPPPSHATDVPSTDAMHPPASSRPPASPEQLAPRAITHSAAQKAG